jgi:hypothetical protein
VDGAARGALREPDRSLLQMMQDACEPRLLRDGVQEPECASSAPGTDPMPNALRVFLTEL